MCDYESVREQLMAQVECQMSNLACVDTHELGEVIDMIKDLEEAKYYCSITEAMEKASEEEILYYTEKYPKNKTNKYMTNTHMETAWDDDKIGRSPSARKAYLEAQQNHKDKAIQLKELDNYISDLSSDIVEMIENASNDERSYLERKISALATKIGQMNV